MYPKTRLFGLIILVVVISLLAANCSAPIQPTLQETKTPVAATATSIPAPTPTFRVNVLDDGSPLPPQVLRHQAGYALENLETYSLELFFDQAMSTDQTSQAWSLLNIEGDIIQGKITWPAENLMRFITEKPLDGGQTYFASLSTQAASDSGQYLSEPYHFQVTTQPGLSITQVFPAHETAEVETKSVITVVFNRPVIPLVTSEQRPDLPVPIEIVPATIGKGEWVNTSVYVFKPKTLLRGASQYTITIPAGLADSDGVTKLEQDYTWQFTTSAPGIDSYWFTDFPWITNMPSGTSGVHLEQSLTIQFRQPMDEARTEAALSLTSMDGKTADLEKSWSEDGTTLVFTPTRPLSLETFYTLSIEQSAQAIGGGPMDRPLVWDFTTNPYPKLIKSLPANGSRPTEFSGEFHLSFASAMRVVTVKDRVVFDPPLEKVPEWYFYGGDYNYEVFEMYFYGLAPSTDYTVTLLPGMEDLYGNKITENRIIRFRTGSYAPSVYLRMPQNSPVLYRNGIDQDVYVSCRNLSSLKLRLYQMDAETYVKMQDWRTNINEWGYTPQPEDLVWSKDDRCNGKRDETVTKKFTMALPEEGILKPGFYFLTLDSPEVPKYGTPNVDRRVVLVASSNLTLKTTFTEALAWMTDLTTGQPVSDVSVVFFDYQFKQVGKGISDANGLVYIDGLSRGTDWYEAFYAVAEDPEHFGFAYSNWGSGISPYDFGIWTDYYTAPNALKAYVYTDRPLYRPGQPVYFKGIVRQNDDFVYSLPSQRQVKVIISSFEEKVFERNYTLSDHGSFSGELILDEAAALGDYSIEVTIVNQEGTIGNVSFGVADYRKVDFQVNVDAQPVDLNPGDNFTTTINANYYSGGPLVYADVAWSLQSSPFEFKPPDEYSAYSFTDVEQDAGYYDYYGDQSINRDFVADGKATTDENGRAEITLPASLSDKGDSRLLTLEAAVTDFAGTVAAGQSSVVVHRSAVYPGIRPQVYVGQVGIDLAFDLVALDWNGGILSGGKVNVEIVERRWYSVQEQAPDGRLIWTSSVEDIPVTYFEGVTLDSKGKAVVNFKPPNGGVYRARVLALDTKGNQGHASTYLWVAGQEYIPWRQDNQRSFDLVKDRPSYSPGDTAELLIASPFPGENYALLTVERGHLRYQEVLNLVTNSTVYKLLITEDMAPNIYVSVLIIRGAGPNNPPNFRQAIIELKVDRMGQEIKVQVTPDRTQAAPGELVNYTVRTTDSNGIPMSAEVSLGLSDLAALALRDPNSQPILDYFYFEGGLSVWTAVPLVFSIEDFNAELASNEALSPEGQASGSGGGKGYGETGVIKVRGNFLDTAFWKADIVTDAQGQATLSITLPDNLTTWRMDGRAVSLDTHVGQITNDIVSTKPLLIRPQTPRFFVAEDLVTLGAAVHNNTGQDLSVTVSLDADGVELIGAPAQDVTITNGNQAYVSWKVRVPVDSTRVDLVFTAVSGAFSDASLPTLGTLEGQGIPVYKYEVPETVGASGMILEGGTLVEAIHLPPDLDITQGELIVRLEPSLAASMTDGLTYLEQYPYGCVEQTISSFLPNVITTQAFKAVGLSDPELETNLETQVNTALQRLVNFQNQDGGWGWWGLKKSDPLTSAYVIIGLVNAKEAGYLVSPTVMSNALTYLRQQLRKVDGITQPSLLNRQAFLLYTLAQAGQPVTSSTVQLFDERQNMAIYARAFLAESFFIIDPQDVRIQTLLTDLNTAALVSASGTHWEEPQADTLNWNTDTRTTAIVLGVVSRIEPQNLLNANAVRWLMHHRSNGHWLSTQETAWTLMGLTRWMVASGELLADYEYAVAWNGERLGGGSATVETLRSIQVMRVDVVDQFVKASNRLAIARDEGPGNLYYTAHLNLWLPVERLSNLDQGIRVERSYFLADEPGQPVTQVNQGDLVLVRLTVTSPGALHYVIVDDPLPAGLEAVDESLKTSPMPVIPEDFQWERLATNGWGWWYFEHVELRDEKIVLSASYLPAGTYVYTYQARASTPGVFQVIPTTAQEFYFPEVYGRAAGSVFTVLAKDAP